MWVRNVVALGANAWAGCMVPSPSCRWSGTAGMPSPGHPPAAPLTARLALSPATGTGTPLPGAGPLRQVHGGSLPGHRHLDETDGIDKYQWTVAMHWRRVMAGMADGKMRAIGGHAPRRCRASQPGACGSAGRASGRRALGAGGRCGRAFRQSMGSGSRRSEPAHRCWSAPRSRTSACRRVRSTARRKRF